MATSEPEDATRLGRLQIFPGSLVAGFLWDDFSLRPGQFVRGQPLLGPPARCPFSLHVFGVGRVPLLKSTAEKS